MSTATTERQFILDPSGIEDSTADPQPDRCVTIGCQNEFLGGGRCEECVEATPVPNAESYEDVDWSRTWQYTPNDLHNRKQWMGATIINGEKRPFAPWADRDHPDAPDDEDARWKWGLAENYVDGDTVADELSGSSDLVAKSFIQQEDDPISHADFDNVVDPETHSVHPAVPKILDRLGRSFTELSISETGIHVPYFGELPDGVKQARWDLDDEPWGDNDDVPHVEIYDGKRQLVVTGNHVRGTLAAVYEWDDDALYELLDEHDQLPRVSKPSEEHGDFDVDEYEPTATDRTETTTNTEDVIAAINRLDSQRVAEKTIVHGWNDDASTSPNARAFYPKWGPNCNGTANIITERGWNDTGGYGYGGPVVMALIDAGEIRPSNAEPVGGELWWSGVERLRGLGFDIPEYVDSTDSVDSTEDGTERNPIPESRLCDPPELKERVPFDAEKERQKLENEEYEAFIESSRPVAWAHPCGWGKTTSGALGGYKRDRMVALSFATHRKAHEFVNDDDTPENIFHLKGGAQPRDSSCLGANHDGEQCSDHDDQRPLMCELFERDPDDPLRQKFEQLEGLMGSVRAHNEVDPHNGEKCEWLEQYDELDSHNIVACVHEHQGIDILRGEGDTLIDESTRLMGEDHAASVEDLLNSADALDSLRSLDRNYSRLADFARRLSKSVRTAGEPRTDPPSIEWGDDPSVSKAETLASLRVQFNEHLRSKIDRGDLPAKPGIIDVIIGFAASCGLDAKASGKALGGPKALDRCPRCGAGFSSEQGNRVCRNDDCGWSEDGDTYLPPKPEIARFNTYQDTTPSGHSEAVIELLPNKTDLPDSPLLLDATVTSKKVEGLYGSEPTVVGDDHNIQMNMNVTQITDGSYHKSTIQQTDSLQRKFQTVIDWACEEYDNPLFGAKRDVLNFFEIPENAETVHYGGLRGLNYPECDTVFALGAPHWDVPSLYRNAELLSGGIAIDNGIEVGGIEYSTRREDGELVGNPPKYRKFQYVDDDDRGVEMPVKEFSGLVGDLFYEKRESELEQLIHRTRPITSEETIDVYLLTNVPTETPVDKLMEMDTLVEQAKGRSENVAEMDVPAGAKDLYQDLSDDETFTRNDLCERANASDRTVKRWASSLKENGAIEPTGESRQRMEVLAVAN